MAGQGELGGVLDGDHALVGGNLRRQEVQQCRLPGTGPARHEHIAARGDDFCQKIHLVAGGRSRLHQRIEGGDRLSEAADRHHGPIDAGGRHDRV